MNHIPPTLALLAVLAAGPKGAAEDAAFALDALEKKAGHFLTALWLGSMVSPARNATSAPSILPTKDCSTTSWPVSLLTICALLWWGAGAPRG